MVVDPHEVETLANKREREGLFMISSRSYEDNTDLMDSLNSEQDMLRSREYVEGVYEAKDCTKKADHFLN